MSGTTIVARQMDPAASPFVNILDNGGFEIWQRGTSFSNPANLVYTTDRWQIQLSGSPTYTISQEPSIVDSGNYAVKYNVTATVTGLGWHAYLYQSVENFAAYRGMTLSLSVRVWSNTAGVMRIYLNDGVQLSVFSPYHPGDSTYHTLSVTLSVSPTATQLVLGVGSLSNDVLISTNYIDSAMLVVGSQPVAFQPLHPQIDLARCQRYYELGHVQNTFPILRPGAGSGDAVWMWTPFVVQKRVVPTVTPVSVAIVISNVGGSGGGDSSDTGAWGISVAQTQLSGASIEITRASDGGLPAVLAEYTWVATADL
jgi:hypothetical protein